MTRPVPKPADLPRNATYYSMTDFFGAELGESDPTYDAPELWPHDEPIKVTTPLLVIGLRIPTLTRSKRLQCSERCSNTGGGKVCVLSNRPNFSKRNRVTAARRVGFGSMFRTSVTPLESGDVYYIVYKMNNIFSRSNWRTALQLVLR